MDDVTAWLRAMFISIICTIGVAGVGFQPALAALCDPIIQADIDGRGDALMAYVPILKLRSEGVGSERLSVLDQDLIHNIRDWSKPKDVYKVDWVGSFEMGCTTGREKGISARQYQTIHGRFSFSPGFFDFVDGIHPVAETRFSLGSQLEERNGIRLEATGIFGSGKQGRSSALRGKFYLDFWNLNEYLLTTVMFRKPEAISTVTMSETTIRRPYGGERLPEGAVPFSGGGYSISAQLTWEPSERMAFTYTGDSLFGHRWASGLVYETFTLQTNKQFVGIDGYLENRPLGEGRKRNHRFNERLMPTHRFGVDVGVVDPLYVDALFNLTDEYIESLMVGMRRPLGHGRINLGWDAAKEAFGGTISYPFSIGSTVIYSQLNTWINHVIPQEIALVNLGGSLIVSF